MAQLHHHENPSQRFLQDYGSGDKKQCFQAMFPALLIPGPLPRYHCLSWKQNAAFACMAAHNLEVSTSMTLRLLAIITVSDFASRKCEVRFVCCREGYDSCALMLRPRLLAFSVDGTEPRELALDIAAVPVDAVTVLDSWYHVIVHTGSHLASWVKQVCAHIRSLLSFMRFILVLTKSSLDNASALSVHVQSWGCVTQTSPKLEASARFCGVKPSQ
jgi:hypothetical protein